MKRISSVFALCLLSIILFSVFLPIYAHAEGSYGVDLYSDGYASSVNPYAWGQCTWFCWGRAYELGMEMPTLNGNAVDWYSLAQNAGYTCDSTPSAYSIMVSPNGTPYLDDYGNYINPGHVFFVERVEGDYAYVTEGNAGGAYHEDYIELSDSSTGRRNWGNGDSFTITGYIHLAPDILFSDNKNVARTKENVVFHYEGLTEASQVEICFEKNGEVYFRGNATSSRNYTTYFNNEGVYYVFVRGQLNGSWFESKKLRVDITNPVFLVSESNPMVGQAITFSYDKLTSANIVELCIEKDSVEYGTIDMTKSKTYSYVFDEEGTFTAYVRAYYSGTRIDSEPVEITVLSSLVDVEEIQIDTSAITLIVNEAATLTATVLPSDATDKTVTWTSSDNEVATVNDGEVTAVAPGTAVITAQAGDKTATCTVTVTAKPEYSIGALEINSTDGTHLTAIPASEFLVTVPITKQTGDNDAVVFLVSYSESGQYKGLIYVKVKNAPINATVEVTLPVDNSLGEIARLKAFILPALGSFAPLAAAVEFGR